MATGVYADETFEGGATPAGWSFVNGRVNTTKPGTGTYSAEIDGTDGNNLTSSERMLSAIYVTANAFRPFMVGAHVWVGALADFQNGAGDQGSVIGFFDSTENTQTSCAIKPDGAVEIRDASGTTTPWYPNRALRATSATGLVTVGWNYIEVGSLFTNSGASKWIMVNGALAVSWDGDNLNTGPSVNRRAFALGPRKASAKTYIDNMYIHWNDADSLYTAAVGPQRALNPDGPSQDGSAFQEWFDLAEIASAHDLAELDTRAAYLKVRGNT